MLDKLVAPEDILGIVKASGLANLAFETEHADALTEFPTLSKHDPFDRMLLAQAKTEDLSLLTSDGLLLEQGFDFVVNARD